MAKPPPDIHVTVEKIWSTMDDSARTVEQNPLSTIKPGWQAERSVDRVAQELLGRLGEWEEGGVKGKLKIEGTLGKGGMGVVHLARQLSVGRPVALKSLRNSHQGDVEALKLLREGWVTGAMEHPNVVPVHDIGLDAEGYPLVILKRIEGTDWLSMILSPDEREERHGKDAPLEWDLQTFTQVCNAVSYAHSRGVLHRDIKPSNVMVGEFGEVYLMDWGIAVCTEDDGSGRLPLAADATGLAGTPSYMAPEMLSVPPELSRRTDLYLLGATLFHVVTGRAPHLTGDCDAKTVIENILRSDPEIPPDMPPELAEICCKAMALDPEDRYESVEQLKQAVQLFLKHRGSVKLADEAEQRLEELIKVAACEPGHDEEARRIRLYRLFSESRFGYLEALKTWPGNDVARSGLYRGAGVLIRFELSQKEPRAAAALLAEMDHPPADLMAEMESLLKEKETQRQEMEALTRMGRQMDPNVGRRKRVLLTAIIGLVWSLSPLINAIFYQDTPDETNVHYLQGTGILALIVLPLFIWARRPMMKTAINRRLSGTVLFMLLGEALFSLVIMYLDLTALQGVQLHFFFWFTIASMVSITVEWRLLPTAVAYLACILLVLLLPEARYYLMCLSNLCLTLNAVIVWRRPLSSTS